MEPAHSFDHYKLDASIYVENLAAYALGRLLRRLEWHHEQWIVLLAESYCGNQERGQHDKGRHEVEEIEAAIRYEAGSQRALSISSFDQLRGVIKRLPTSAHESLASFLEKVRAGLFEWSTGHLEADACDLATEVLRVSDDLISSIIRLDGLRDLLKPHTKPLTRLRGRFAKVLNSQLTAFFTLGESVEQLICPREVFRHMTLGYPRFICARSLPQTNDPFEVVARANCFHLGYHSFSPASLKLTPTVVTECRQSLQAVQRWDDGTASLFTFTNKKPLEPFSPSPAEDDCDIEIPEEDLQVGTLNVEPVVHDTFECRLKANPSHEQLLAKLHSIIVGPQVKTLKRNGTLAMKSTIEGAFDEHLTIDGIVGTLERKGFEAVKVKGEKQLGVLQTLIKAKGSICSKVALTDVGKDNLYQAISRLNVLLGKVDLKAECVREEGYQLTALPSGTHY